jgi:hypothetical protein
VFDAQWGDREEELVSASAGAGVAKILQVTVVEEPQAHADLSDLVDWELHDVETARQNIIDGISRE